MPALVRPFTGYLPSSSFGSRVVGPARSMLPPDRKDDGADDPLSFRHVVGRSAGPPRDVADAWLRDAAAAGAIDAVAGAVAVHSAERDGVRALGVLADISLAAYEDGAIRAHEKTLEKTEAKMVRYMAGTRLYGNPVMLAHRANPGLTHRLHAIAEQTPDADFVARDGTRHRLWVLTGRAADEVCSHYVDDLYIADGHHRLEAARWLASSEGRNDDWMPAGIYGEHEFVVWAFARGVRRADISADELIHRLSTDFDLAETDATVPRPTGPHTFGVRIGGRSFVLTIPDDQVTGDALDQLDVNLLQRRILEPLFAITDPRREPRLEVTADSSDDAHDPDAYLAWFLPYPTSPGEVMQVADLDHTMPPKSTFFLPKIPGGIIIRPLDTD